MHQANWLQHKTHYGCKEKHIPGDQAIQAAEAYLHTALVKGEPPHVVRPVSFDSIVIDEAAQASEPDIVLPATSASCRVIVVGDHKQLGLVEDISGYFRIFQDISGWSGST